MLFTDTALPGVRIVDIEPHEDCRGFFARCFCAQEFAEEDLASEFVQCNLSWNDKAGTLRGLHMQVEPHWEGKLVRCTSGAIYDVAVNARPDSDTYLEWVGVELTADNRRMLYVPRGFAHGYQTLTDGSEVFYMVSQYYAPESEKGFRWDDPAVGIEWPLKDPILSEKDRSYPLLGQ